MTRILRIALLALLVVANVPAPLPAADPFYAGLLRSGTAARLQGDLRAAEEDLRIACFGLLDEPALLAQGLAELALAQQAAGRGRAAEGTLGRLLEVERRFRGYRDADLPGATRSQLEELVYRTVDPARLRGLEVFAPLAERREMEALASATPADRRVMLQQRRAAEPGDPRWLRMAADLELEVGQPAAALPHLGALLELTPDDATLRCERFRAAGAAQVCELLVADHVQCPIDAATAELAQPTLVCLTAAAQWEAADAFLNSLPASLRSTSRIRKLDRQVQRALRDARAEALAITPPEAAAPEEEAVQSDAPDPSAPAAADPSTVAQGTETAQTDPLPDPCDPFRSAARSARCDAVIAELPACAGAAAEREIAPAVMRCHADAGDWQDAVDFASSLPPQVRGLSKIRKLERRAAKQLAKVQVADESPEAADATGAGEAAGAPTAADGPETSPPDQAPASPSAPSGRELDEARALVGSANDSEAITRAYAVTSRLALDHPDHPEAQHLAAQGAYRAAQWDRAVAFFEAGGPTGEDQPLLTFYYAVALFETGRADEAAEQLERALPRIRRTPFVDSYVARIRAAAGRN